jgi:hypothetical protein
MRLGPPERFWIWWPSPISLWLAGGVIDSWRVMDALVLRSRPIVRRSRNMVAPNVARSNAQKQKQEK